jgi:hypothetical protein
MSETEIETENVPVAREHLKCAGCDKLFKHGDFVFVVAFEKEKAPACRMCARKEKTESVMIFTPPGASVIERDRAARRIKKLNRRAKKYG